ncbi:putative transmembrane protein [Trypanosoma theileri]|uniref:Putative transmembrane protein n=1 Tax=Trypanosoma theileri TaxID=67003 RepID=A0A1X0PAU3_9TRYP|nr:putative transmembrane protein [Trypanosoma theileri]ORC93709.1 putative transmembrane protein [Trypanosoma theileri]
MKVRRRSPRTVKVCGILLLFLCIIVIALSNILQEDTTDNHNIVSNGVGLSKPKSYYDDKKDNYNNNSNNTCGSAKMCLDCLFPVSSKILSDQVYRPSTECFWCAATSRCMYRGSKELCEDREEQSCPAVLHSHIPNSFRVIHVGIQKGGPEALIQLHLALNRWGFLTTLDTRSKEKGGSVLPFFRNMYKNEFSRAPPLRWFKNYDEWHKNAQEGDVLIATETWPCFNRNYFEKGIRQMQWHLTVWPRRDRSHCTIAGHTNYITMTYMNQSKLALLYPYISPHIIKLAQSHSSWRNTKRRGTDKIPLVLFDSDVKLQNNDLLSRNGVMREVIRATGFRPEDLYALYGQATAGIDLRLPGAERFIFEAVLFDVCVIVDNSLVGGCSEDVPIPEEFRVPEGNLSALNNAIDRCIRDYDSVISKFTEMKEFTLRQKVTFERQVRRYFSNSVHITSVVCTQEQSNKFLLRFILNTLLYVPFATVEIRLAEGVVGLTEGQQTFLLNQSWLAAVRFVQMDAKETSEVCQINNEEMISKTEKYGSTTIQLARFILLTKGLSSYNSKKRSLLTMFVPINGIIVTEDVVHYITSQLALVGRHHDHDNQEAVTDKKFPIYILKLKSDGMINLPLIAVWTADVSSLLSCSHMVNNNVPLLSKLCQYKPNTDGDAVLSNTVVLHDGGDIIPLALVVDSKDNNDEILQSAWSFMCMHELWKDLIGEC